jgi:hypothetical protein
VKGRNVNERPIISLHDFLTVDFSPSKHICADTLRSITTLLAASFSWIFPDILSPAAADSWGAIFISVIIIVSLSPLIQGIFATAGEIRDFHCIRERF